MILKAQFSEIMENHLDEGTGTQEITTENTGLMADYDQSRLIYGARSPGVNDGSLIASLDE